MSTTTNSTDQPVVVPHQGRVAAIARLVVGLAMTFSVLIFTYGRTFLEGVLLRGRPKPLYDKMLIAAIIAVMLVTAGLSPRLRSPRLDRLLLRGLPGIWLGAIFIAMWFATGGPLPKILVVPLFVLGSLWVPCLAWMLYKPWPWKQRTTLLVVCVLMQTAFAGLFRVEEIQVRFFHVNFNWRSAPKIKHGAELPVVLAPAAGVDHAPDLSRATAHDYPRFLGPNQSGVVNGENLAADWSTTAPREVWRNPVGAGWGSFAIVGDYAVTQEQRGPHECVVCYRLSDVRTEWIHSDECHFDSGLRGSGPRATPTIADGRVYAVGATGLLNCLDGASGKSIWTVDILKDNGGENNYHGVSGSPLVTDEWVIVAPAGVGRASLVAYHKQTGKRVWRGGKFPAGYSSPVFAELAGVPQVLLTTNHGIEGSDFRTGRPLWDFPWANDHDTNCSQPIIVDAQAGRVLFCTGYGKGCVLLEVTAGQNGACAVRDVWQSPGKMKTRFTTAVLHRGYAYGLDDKLLACLDLSTGKQLWKGGRYLDGQVLLAGDLLIVQAESGEVHLVQPDPKKLIELGIISALSSKTWNNPALAGNKLIVRNDREAVCYELPHRVSP